MFNAFQRFFIGGVQKSCFQDKGIIRKMGKEKKNREKIRYGWSTVI